MIVFLLEEKLWFNFHADEMKTNPKLFSWKMKARKLKVVLASMALKSNKELKFLHAHLGTAFICNPSHWGM